MDLSDFDAADTTADAARLLDHAKSLVLIIDTPDQVGAPDAKLCTLANDTFYTAQPPSTTDRARRPAPFPRLRDAFDAAIEQVATPAQKKNKQRDNNDSYNYNLTEFVRRMSPDQRLALKRALHDDVDAIIAAARRDATDATTKLFDGAPLPSASTADVRKALDALHTDAQQQLRALQHRIAALAHADVALIKIDASLAAADAFAASSSFDALATLPPATAHNLKNTNKRAKH